MSDHTPSKWIIPENNRPLALPGVGDYFGNNYAPRALTFGKLNSLVKSKMGFTCLYDIVV